MQLWVSFGLKNQVSLGANETVMGKACFEQWLWDMEYAYAKVKHYHGNNGFFLLKNTAKSVWIKGNLSPFLALERLIKMLWPSMLLKQ